MIRKGRRFRNNTKLTIQDISVIRKDIRLLKQIAFDYGVSMSVIRNVKAKIAWKDVV